MGYYDGGWAPYVPVATRRRNAEKEIARHVKKRGREAAPVIIEGRTIARTFWGKAWCDNLERYGDYANRIPRGRTYVRNGSVVDLHVGEGRIEAYVAGSSLYEVTLIIRPLAPARWKRVVEECAGRIGSLVELLGGRLSDGVMAVLARPGDGLFPAPGEIDMDCSCPDGAHMCKHVAAVLYGVGARLDDQPELFFKLRKVDQFDLVASAEKAPILGKRAASEKSLSAGADLSALFGIELDSAAPRPAAATRKATSKSPASVARKPTRGQPLAPAPSPKRMVAPAPAPAPKRALRKAAAPMSSADLLAAGVPRTTFQNWVTNGLLQKTARRGVYLPTTEAHRRIDEFRARAGGASRKGT